jgi:DNA gyrase subunit A
MLDIDKAIRIIRQTEEDSLVIPNLMSGFSIDQLQAEYIAEIKLRNLNKDYIMSRVSELAALKKEIDELKELAGSDEKIKELICSQLKEIAKKYGKPRRTDIITEEQVIEIPEDVFIEDYPIKLFLTEHGYFKKISQNSLRYSGDQNLKDDDAITQELEATNKHDIIFFSDKCNAYKAKAYDLKEHKASSMGEYLQNLLGLEDNEKIIYLTATLDYSGTMIFIFENGKAARVAMESYATKANRKRLINAFSDKSKLICMEKLDSDADFAFVRNDSKLLIANSSLITVNASKNTVGMQVMTLRKNTRIYKAFRAELLDLSNAQYYKVDKIPSAGHFATPLEIQSVFGNGKPKS